MNPRYRETQAKIRECITHYIEASDLSAKHISLNVLGKSANYLSNCITSVNVIGPAVLKTVATIVPFPEELLEKAAAEALERKIKRGQPGGHGYERVPQRWIGKVAEMIKERPLLHRPWIKS